MNRGQKVMLDSQLAELYQVPTFRLNEAVKRNQKRFPADFMFRLTRKETEILTSQIAISKKGSGGRRTAPYAFTEHGVSMLSAVLNSDRAVQMSILIVRAFVKLREFVASRKELAGRMEKLEAAQQQTTSVITILAEEIEELKRLPAVPPKHVLDFVPWRAKGSGVSAPGGQPVRKHRRQAGVADLGLR